MSKKKLKIITVIIIILILTIGLPLSIYASLLRPVNKKDSTLITFDIPYKTSSNEVLNSLEAQGLIKSSLIAKIYMKTHQITNIQAGTYILSKDMDLKTILNKFTTGKVLDDEITITFIEGKRLSYYVNLITKNFSYTVSEINDVLNDKEFLKELIDKYWFITDEILNKDIYYPLEGYIFPDTYNFKKDATIKEIILTLIEGLNTKLEPYKDTILNSGYTPHEILTLASIVELEGVDDSSRSKVASVFYNRLKSGWTLGSDVTTYYAFKKDFSSELTLEEYNKCNPYNTRSACVKGLPVGPICASGLESLKATINPEITEYYYFVADKNKNTYYAKTDSEFNAIITDLKNKNLWYTYN